MPPPRCAGMPLPWRRSEVMGRPLTRSVAALDGVSVRPVWSRDETSGCARSCAWSRLQTPDSATPTPNRSNPSPASPWTRRPCPQHTLVESLSHLPAIGPRSNLSPAPQSAAPPSINPPALPNLFYYNLPIPTKHHSASASARCSGAECIHFCHSVLLGGVRDRTRCYKALLPTFHDQLNLVGGGDGATVSGNSFKR